MKRILYITSFFEQQSCSAAIRNNAWVEGLIDLGYEVTVDTVEWPEDMKSRFLVSNNRARIRRTKLSQLNLLKKTASLKSKELFPAIKKIRHLIRDLIFFPDICANWPKKYDIPSPETFDIIITSSDFKSSHFVGLELKKRYPSKKWVQIWGDPWATDTNLNNISRQRAKINEKMLLHKADHVVYVSPLTRDYYAKLYPQIKEKLNYIPRGYFKKVTSDRKDTSNIRLVYTGVLNLSGRNIFNLLDAISQYNTTASRKIDVGLYGCFSEDIINKAAKYPFVDLHGSVDYENILRVYSEADMLVFLSNAASSTQIPGKLFDYSGTNLPILCLVQNENSDICTFLNKSDRNLIINNTKEDISANMLKIVDFSSRNFEIDESLSPQSIAQKLSDLID